MLYLALEPRNGGDPVTLARVADRDAIVHVARKAIAESHGRVADLLREDEVLGMLQTEEASRLERALTLVVPELRTAAVQ